MIITHILGILIFLFLLWKTLKDDYQYEKIFSLGFVVLVSVAVSILVLNFTPYLYWFWIMGTIMTISIALAIRKQRMKFFEVIEGFAISILPWLSFYFLNDSIQKSSLSSFLAFWLTLICIFIYFLLKNYYRTFSWYKSGRVGFAGISTLLIFFIVRMISSIFFPYIISFSGKSEIFFSGSTALLLGILLYNLYSKKE
jgi:hypothetical protein